ncbi:hypothetical protein [Streptomyces tateyamensis]|nr:hypothetical protein [Streptomyces tateyamensis]
MKFNALLTNRQIFHSTLDIAQVVREDPGRPITVTPLDWRRRLVGQGRPV